MNKNAVLAVILLSSFVSSSNNSMINVALPAIGSELSLDAVLLGWIVTAHLVATASFQVPLGKLADIAGRRKFYLLGTIVFTIATLLSGMSDSGAVLILSRIFTGVGGAMMITTGLAILTSIFSPEERGQAIAANMAAIYLGIALGPFIGGILTEYLGWRSIFFASSFIGLATVLLVILKLKGEWADAKGERFDYYGSILFALTLSALMYGFSELPSLQGLIFFAAGLAGILIFVLLESRIENPVLDIKIFRGNSMFSLSIMAVIITYSGIWASTFLLSLYLQYIKGFSPQSAGMVLVAQPAVMTFFAMTSGRLAKRFTPRYVASAGLALNCIGLLILSLLGGDSTLWHVICGMAVFGIGMGLFSSPNVDMAMGSVGKRLLGVASGVIATMRSIGMVTSMGITMILFSLIIGDTRISPEYYPDFLLSMKIGYTVFAVLCFIGIFVQLSAREGKQ